MKILELFSGTESFSKVARERGHECFTVDLEEKFNPDLVKDIMKLKIDDIPFRPDIIWASPPCTTFSVMTIGHYWNEPKQETIEGLMMVYKAFAMIKVLKPKYWMIENPRGILRTQELMKRLPRNTVTYCQYGDSRMKPTDIWNNLGLRWIPKQPCKNGDSCHDSAPRGSARKGTQGLSNKTERIRIPRELCLEIIKACEN